MRKNKSSGIKLAVCLLAFAAVGGTVFGDVVVESNGAAVTITNNTDKKFTLGGARFQTNGQNWTQIASDGMAWTIQTADNYVTDVYVKQSAASWMKEFAPSKKISFQHQPALWGQDGSKLEVVKGSEEFLFRGSPAGKPDKPVEYPSITIDELKEIIKNSDYKNPNYKYSDYDSLGSNGGKTSGGFLDTYFDETQILFAVPKGNFTQKISNTTIKAMSGKDAPAYYMALAMGQEFLQVDAQWMFAMGAKETFSGTNVTPWATDATAVASGNYTNWHVEGPTMGDRALAYPQYFPKYETKLAGARDLTSSGLTGYDIADYYVGAYNGQTSPSTICGLMVSALVQYANYDIMAEAGDICWKYSLQNAADPYMGLGAMLSMYNLGQWGEIGKIKAMMDNGGVESLINDPNARNNFAMGNNNYRTDILSVAQELINASRDYMSGGSNSQIIDFQITLEQLRSMFFGARGTVEKQGEGGILKFYYDPEVKDVIDIRQNIWDNLGKAFDLLKDKSNTISYRYDFLTAIRTVKTELPFNRSFTVSGDASTLVANNTSSAGCTYELVNGIVDEEYPEFGFTKGKSSIRTVPDSTICSVYVDIRDNILCKLVKWSVDNSWSDNSWQPSEMENAPDKNNTFRFAVQKEYAETFKQSGSAEDAKLGMPIWIWAEDASGNAVVKKAFIRFIKEFKRPTPKSAALFDTDGDGFPDSLKAVIIRNDLNNLKDVNYTWRLGTKNSATKLPSGVKTSSARDSLFINFDDLDDGSLTGMLYMEYDSIDYEKETTKKVKDSVAIIDSCGPAIKGFAEFTAHSVSDDSKPDTLRIQFSEDIKGEIANGKTVQFIFAKDDDGDDPLEISATKVSEDNGIYMFLFDKDKILTYTKDGKPELHYTHVKIKFDGGITDAADNPPLENNRWALISDLSASLNWIDFTITNAEFYSNSNPADGYVDSIKIDFKLDLGKLAKFDELEPDIKKLIVESLELPASREFNKPESGDFNFVGENSVEITVSQNKDKVSAKTFTDEADIIKINSSVRSENIDTVGISAETNAVPKDFIAPVIIKGKFSPMQIENAKDEIVDTLIIEFSEDVSGEIRSDKIKAFDESSGKEYRIAFDAMNAAGNIVKLKVKNNCDNTFPELGDSIQIERGISDNNGNKQEIKTVWATLEVGRTEPSYNIVIYPHFYNPQNPEFEDEVKDKYDLNGTDLAIIVQPIGIRCGSGELPKGMSGNAIVLDKLGNKIAVINNFKRSNGALVGTWDGKNTRKRNVASGQYQAIIQITDDEGNSKTTMHKIGIKTY